MCLADGADPHRVGSAPQTCTMSRDARTRVPGCGADAPGGRTAGQGHTTFLTRHRVREAGIVVALVVSASFSCPALPTLFCVCA